MKSVHRKNSCDGCGEPFGDKHQAVAIIPFVEIEPNPLDNSLMRLKLSVDAIDIRACKVFCPKCLNLNNFIIFDLPGV